MVVAGAAVVVVGFGLPLFVQVILQFPPLEPFFPSVTTLMAKFPLTLAVSFPFLPQSLRKTLYSLIAFYSPGQFIWLNIDYPYVVVFVPYVITALSPRQAFPVPFILKLQTNLTLEQVPNS